jgi:NhaP-type Na+/H+ or K+/H+ antiporter
MLSATDPVAVVALVKELGMNQRIGTLIEGEGLMNDGSAIVLFNVFKGAIVSKGGLVAHEVFVTGLRLALGGPLVGIAIGAATSFCLANFTFNDMQSEVTLTVVGCYSCFLIAEGTPLHVSGVLAVVFAGLYLSFYGRGNISVQVEHSLHSFWHLAEYIADTLVFFVAGVVMASKMMADDIDAHDWRMLLLLFVALQFIRGVVVLASWPVLKRGYGITWQEGVVLTLGGLRGAVGLCLALTVEEFSDEALPRATKDKIVSSFPLPLSITPGPEPFTKPRRLTL